jgi:8-oxo-dGTP diphosphatase
MKHQFSAGGIVYRKKGEELYILLGKHSGYHKWVFPKGIIGDKKGKDKESKEEAALREVREETGITGKIMLLLHPVIYWFKADDEKIKKTVYYYLMEYMYGDTADHDTEMEDVQWVHVDKVNEMLTFAGEKRVWTEAREQLHTLGM